MSVQFSLFEDEETQTITGEDTRVCIKCSRELSIKFFQIDAYHANGGVRRRPECVDCRKKAQSTTRFLKRTAPPIPNNHRCPICMRDSDSIKGTNHPSHNSWCLDHDHETGLFRGWLCHQCNRMLGIAKDDVSLLQRAINYLTKSGAN